MELQEQPSESNESTRSRDSAGSTGSVGSSYTKIPITNVRLVRGLQTLWVVLFLVILALLPIRIPEQLRDCGCTPEVVKLWDQFGIAQFARTAFTISELGQLVLSLGLGALLIFRRGNDRTAVVFAFIFLGLANGAAPGRFALTDDWWQLVYRVSLYIYLVGFISVLYLFPDGRFHPRVASVAFITAAGLYLAILFLNESDPVSGLLVNSGHVVGIIGGLATMIYRYRTSSIVQRQQIKWLLVVVVVVCTYLALYLFGLTFQSPDVQAIVAVSHVLGTIIISLIPVCIALALFRYRLFEIDLIVNRSLVTGAVTVFLGIIFFALFFPIQIALQNVLGPERAVVAAAAAGGLCAALYNPTRRRIQHFIDTRFYGLRFDLNELHAAQTSKPEILNPGYFTGRTFGGCEVLGLLGRGGMGEVYKGFKNDQTVAIKIVPADLATNQQFQIRFQREAETLKHLDHPHIVRYVDHGVEDGVYYLVMDFIDGRELKELILKSGRLTLEESVRLLDALASALDYAHQNGVIHRDVKPSNVMLKGAADHLMLMDFGLARLAESGGSITGTGAIGTIDYMAPEQILEAKTVDERADIYALGVMMFEMLTGERPFKGEAAQVMFAHLTQPPPNPRDLVPELPQSVARAIQRALAKEPPMRFATASAFLNAIQPRKGMNDSEDVE